MYAASQKVGYDVIVNIGIANSLAQDSIMGSAGYDVVQHCAALLVSACLGIPDITTHELDLSIEFGKAYSAFFPQWTTVYGCSAPADN